VRLAGMSSWRFAESEPQMPHVALFVRDSVGLVVPAAPDVPPVLVDELADHRAVLPDIDRANAGEQWVSWWRQLVAHELSAQHPPGGLDERTWLRRRADQMLTITDSSDFAALTDRPVLRIAVAATFLEACRWTGEVKRSRMSAPRPRFGWSLVKQAAEDVAFGHGVDVGDMDGTVIVLTVEGMWSHLLGPGTALCSTATAADAWSAYALLRDVFGSQLR
jgi:hypothetical protein